MTASERLGAIVGELSAPFFRAVSHARHARTFHPKGDLVRVKLEALPLTGTPWLHALRSLGERLSGDGVARFSSALWKSTHWPDILGCAIAFLDARGRAEQHLLLATMRRVWTLPIAPFFTRVQDYLANDYFGVSPFTAPGLEQIWLRLHPSPGPTANYPSSSPRGATTPGPTRRDRLALEIDQHRTLALEASGSPWGPWTAFATLGLTQLLAEDPPELEFNPFLDGRGLIPRGFVHAMRHGAYAGSQQGRPHLGSG